MTITETPPRLASRRAPWVLALSPGAFVALIVINGLGFSVLRVPLFDDITRDQMDQIAPFWILSQTMLASVFAIGAGAIAAVAARLRQSATLLATLTIIAAVAAAVLAIGFAIPRIVAVGFTESRLGDNAAYALSEPLGLASWVASLVSIGLLCATLIRTRLVRVVPWIVGAGAVALLAATIVAYLLLPPFLLSFLWLPLGVALLRSSRSRTASA